MYCICYFSLVLCWSVYLYLYASLTSSSSPSVYLWLWLSSPSDNTLYTAWENSEDWRHRVRIMSQRTQDAGSMYNQCWDSVADDGPPLTIYWFYMLCSLCLHYTIHTYQTKWCKLYIRHSGPIDFNIFHLLLIIENWQTFESMNVSCFIARLWVIF